MSSENPYQLAFIYSKQDVSSINTKEILVMELRIESYSFMLS